MMLAGVASRASRDPRDGEDRADGDHRVGRRQDDQVGVGDGLDHAWARRRLVGSDRHDVVRLGRVQPHPVLLEVDRPSAALCRLGRR